MGNKWECEWEISECEWEISESVNGKLVSLWMGNKWECEWEISKSVNGKLVRDWCNINSKLVDALKSEKRPVVVISPMTVWKHNLMGLRKGILAW